MSFFGQLVLQGVFAVFIGGGPVFGALRSTGSWQTISETTFHYTVQTAKDDGTFVVTKDDGSVRCIDSECTIDWTIQADISEPTITKTIKKTKRPVYFNSVGVSQEKRTRTRFRGEIPEDVSDELLKKCC